MLQFIHNDFKLDLTHLKVSFNSKNIWFTNEVNSDYSFPFNVPIDVWEKITNSIHNNSVNGITKFEGKLYADGHLNNATLKAREVKGNFVSCIIYSGFEGFNVFQKKLSELPLEKFDVLNIKDHALTIINQDYPAVNYNFPMIHTDKYNDNEKFNSFNKVFNNYENGAFLENYVEDQTGVNYIRNIMQPLPYLLYVLKKGFEVDGYELAGDILEIDAFKEALIFRDGEYYIDNSKEQIPFKIGISEYVSFEPPAPTGDGYDVEVVNFEKEIIIDKKGDYVLYGENRTSQYKRGGPNTPFLIVTELSYKISRIRNGLVTDLLVYESLPDSDLSTAPTLVFTAPGINIELPISFEAGDVLRFEKTEARRDIITFDSDRQFPYVIDAKLIVVNFLNNDNSVALNIEDKKEIDLSKVVPDMTFSELVESLIIFKKLDIKLDGNKVYMNYVPNQIDRNNAIFLSGNDIKEPLITNNEERTYEISFTDGKKDKDYIYDSVFISKEGAVTNDYQLNDDTTPIKINLLPYPILRRGSINTAIAFDDETSKLRLVFYKKISEINIKPVCYENLDMLIPFIYENQYKDWIDFLINSKTYQWNFAISVEKFRDVTAQSLIYAYNNYHLFTELEKERINHMYWRITAKTESLI